MSKWLSHLPAMEVNLSAIKSALISKVLGMGFKINLSYAGAMRKMFQCLTFQFVKMLK